MKTSLVVVCILLALALSAPIASAQTQTMYIHCWFRVQALQGVGGTMYSTQVFATTQSIGLIVPDWYKYIGATHPYTTERVSDTCERLSATTDGQQYSLSLEEKNWTADKLNIVHVDYTPGMGATAKVPMYGDATVEGSKGYETSSAAVGRSLTPATAAASGPAHHYYCVSKPGQVITYFSAAFDTTETDARTISSRYDMFLQTKYHRKSNGLWSCPESPSLAAAQAALKKEIAQLHATNQQVVETGWAYGATQ